MTATKSIQQKVIEVTSDYLGPAAERFVNRQISTHLKKNPEQLTLQELPKLVDWIRLSFALLTNDTDLVDEYTKRLLSITRNGHRIAKV